MTVLLHPRHLAFPALATLLALVSQLVSAQAADPVPEGERAVIEVLGQPSPPIRMFSRDRTLSGSLHLYSDRSWRAAAAFPQALEGALYYELGFKTEHRYRCTRAGVLRVVAGVSEADALSRSGFQRLPEPPFNLREDEPCPCALYARRLSIDDSFTLPPGAIAAGFSVPRREQSGELLHNGIRLPRSWPPKIDWSGDAPPRVPYLENRPELVPIDVGRQLFVDDFLIESSDFDREYHLPEKYSGNPILKPETALEKAGLNHLPVAAPKSGGLWWNPDKGLFELWYEAGWVTTIAYATSRDGLSWERPQLALNPGTNQVLPSRVKPDSWTVVRDYRAVNPAESFKIFLRGGGSRERARFFLSRDGLDWGDVHEGGITGDRSTMFYNPFRKKWVFSLRWSGPGGRSRAYWEADDFAEGMHWLPDEPVHWARADRLDPPDPRVGDTPSLYNLDAVAYESILLGFFEILHGPANDVNAKKGLPKHTGLNFAYSRDGFHWSRPDRRMAINSSYADTWDRGYVQSLGNLCLVRGDRLWFYYIGFAGDPSVKLGDPGVGASSMRSGLYANGATGVAFLRRDGFASLNAGSEERTLTTRPVTFSGRHLFVNVDNPHGSLVAELVDMDGRAIPPFTAENCTPVRADATLLRIGWKGGDDLSPLANRAVRFRFRATDTRLYAFWVSRDGSGRSDGYVAGGGPGFTCDSDTVGAAALEAESRRARETGYRINAAPERRASPDSPSPAAR